MSGSSPDLAWLLAARGVRSFSQAVLSIITPLYLAAAGYPALTIGAILSGGSLGSLALVLTVGVVADRWGRRPVLVGLAILAAAGVAGFALLHDWRALALMAAMSAIGRGGGAGSGGGWGPFYPAEQPLVAASVDNHDRNRAFATLSLVGVLASALGSLVAGVQPLVRDTLGWDAARSFHPFFWLASAASVLIAWLVTHVRGTYVPGATSTRSSVSARALIGRLWVTNSLNGFIIGVMGPFMTYWFAIRYGVGAGMVGSLYAIVNLATAAGFVVAPAIARRLGSVRAVFTARLMASVCFAAMAVAPIFLLAALAYAARTVLNAISMTLRQSFVMGVSDERSRSAVAAFGNLPAQLTGTATPTLGAYLVAHVSVELPVWLATSAMALNAVLYWVMFRGMAPPEEREG